MQAQEEQRIAYESMRAVEGINSKSDATLAKNLQAELNDVIKRIQNQAIEFNLIDLLERMQFLGPSIIEESGPHIRDREYRYGVMLKSQRQNLLTKGGVPPNDHVQRNLFKLVCAILNIKPIQRAENYLDDSLLDQYLSQFSVNNFGRVETVI